MNTQSKPRIAIVHDTRRNKSNGKYPVKLRATFYRKQKYYSTNTDLTKEEYQEIYSPKPRKKIKDIRDDLFAIEKKAKDIIKLLHDFSFASFEKKLAKKRLDQGSLIASFKDYSQSLRAAGRISTAITYECSINSLNQYKSTLEFEDITAEFLDSYEKQMIEKGNSITTVGIYLRALRSNYPLFWDL